MRSSPHSVVDYTNDNLHLVDDQHYVSLQLQQNDAVAGGDYDVDEPYAYSPSGGYERFDVRPPVWGADRRQSLVLCVSGALSIIFGALCCCCGVLDFVLESYDYQAAFQVESKFTMMVVILGGLASCRLAGQAKSGSVACLLGFSLLGVGAGLCDAVMQALNHHFVTNRLENALDGTVMVFSFFGAITSAVQAVLAVRIARWNDDQSSSNVKPRRLSVITGLFQCFCGLVLSALTVALYARFESAEVYDSDNDNINNVTLAKNIRRQADIKWTLSSELVGHSWLIAMAGISYAITAYHPSRCPVLVCLALQSTALLTTLGNHVHPLSTLYAAGVATDGDAKLAIAQLILYATVALSSTVATIEMIRRLNAEAQISGNSVRHLTEKRGWQLYRHTSLIQMLLAGLYLSVWVVGFSERFLYLLDFTPLPAMMLLHGVLAHVLNCSFSPLLLMINLAWTLICGLYAVRDVYLFDYHTASNTAPDSLPVYGNATFASHLPSIAKLGVHLLLAASALMEAVLSAVLVLMYARTLSETSGIVIGNKLQHRTKLMVLAGFGGAQLASAALIINFGLILLLSQLMTVEYLGDACMLLGLLILITGSCLFLASRTPAVAMPLAAITNVLAFSVLWQHSDTNGLLFSRIIFYYKNYVDDEQQRVFIFSSTTFALCLLSQTICGLSLIGLEDVLMDCKFESNFRVEMVVRREMPTVAPDQIQLRSVSESSDPNR